MKIHTLKRTCWIAIVISVISLILTAINIWAYIKNKWYLLLYSLNLESLGEGNFIFVGGGTDEWAANVPSEWIEQVLDIALPEPIANELRMLKAKLEKSAKLRLRRMLCVG